MRLRMKEFCTLQLPRGSFPIAINLRIAIYFQSFETTCKMINVFCN